MNDWLFEYERGCPFRTPHPLSSHLVGGHMDMIHLDPPFCVPGVRCPTRMNVDGWGESEAAIQQTYP